MDFYKMKKLILVIAFLASFTEFAEAQTSRNPCYTTGALTTQGIPNCIGVGTSTPLPVTTTTTPGAPLDVEGNVASGVADSGNPVKVGGVYNTSPPTFVSGQRADGQVGLRGSIKTQLMAPDSSASNTFVAAGADAVSNTYTSLMFQTTSLAFNGTSWDRNFTCANSAVVNVTATTTEIVALTASQVIRVCSIALSATAISTAQIVYGTGANCGTGTTNLTGAMQLAAGTPLAISSGNGSLLRTASANALCLTAGAGAVTGFITYAKY